MKTYLTYGVVMTIACALLNLVLFFTGLHSDAAKFGTAQRIGAIGLVIICVICIVLGTKARRTEFPATEEFGYGKALWAGVCISFFAALFGIVTNHLYFNVINPGLKDIIVQVQLDKMEAKGMSGAQLEQGEKMVRMFLNPVLGAVVAFISGMFWGTLISLITAAFLKRPASEEFPAAET